MRAILIHLFRFILFWLLFFTFHRALFFGFYFSLIRIEHIGFVEVLRSFYAALPLDLATTCYFTLIPFLLLLVWRHLPYTVFQKIIQVYVLVLILVYSLTALAEIGIYGEWKTKLSYKALAYLRQPSEIVQTVHPFILFLLLLLLALITWGSFKIYNRFFFYRISQRATSFWPGLLLFFLGVPLLFLGARGGIQAIPISISSAYFSKHQIVNLAAVNPFYNIVFSVLNSQNMLKENVFQSMPEDEAIELVQALHQLKKDTTVSVLTTDRPNIVVLLLESWSADLIESLGGVEGITPNFRELEKEGLLFTRFYASGNRSQQAIGSLYAGLPGIPITTITNHPEKYAALPSLSKDLNKAGYHTSFYFGGQLNYGNILSYLIYNELDHIIEGKDLPGSMPRGKLGVHDGIFLPWAADQLSELPEPFFSTIFTLSSHSPYDFPMEWVIHWPEIEKPYVNGAYYTDMAIGTFFEAVKTTDWYERSLFILVADHSKNSYKNHPLESFEYHKIPLLLVGPALKPEYRNKQMDIISGNTDLPATLLHQLGLTSDNYFWSKNLFNPYTPQFAYFELIEGLGWKNTDGHFAWNCFADRYYQKEIQDGKEEQVLKEGKAYLQVLFNEFIGLSWKKSSFDKDK
ncbi:MAG: sulfatase-like hydrolase/transferase [Bacteroidales bacterium]|jgi:phosphoglycerol transferase MdoB-like AlkP superfamily enzyme|nr:sulfatase-like hydrolase/transferase [Bacteroidales bacterium]MDD3701159.1 sulfatase-like hydrolase/transferase [Bacteroidales bacterium]MDY0368606.1 sulfatase-like hydrolase/transferase [Bacteroidales bacterium]